MWVQLKQQYGDVVLFEEEDSCVWLQTKSVFFQLGPCILDLKLYRLSGLVEYFGW